MKKIIYILLISSFFASCKKWLDITPFDALPESKVITDERNTNSALNGIYIGLSSDALYGKELSCGMMDVLAQHYMIPPSLTPEHRYLKLYEFAYTNDNAKEILAATFKAAYKRIGDCNVFLEKIGKIKNQFEETKYNIYCGEALAIRTLLHFDMLRLFGPMGNDLGASAVPYYNISTDTPQKILTGLVMVDTLIMDIDRAIEYLKSDPILIGGKKAKIVPSEDTGVRDFFTDFRNTRLNYYAANALKARMCLYKGTAESKAKAYEIASRLLDGKDPSDPSKSTNFNKKVDDETQFELMRTNRYNENIFFDELLFCINNIERNNVNKSMFSPDLNERLIGGGTTFHYYLYGGSTTTAPGGVDPGPRAKMWNLNEMKGMFEFNRFSVTVTNPYYPYHNQMQGVIRIGELYLIAAETSPDLETKRSWVEKMRIGKGYDAGNAATSTDAQLNTLIAVEFEKDTYGEGQYFFFAKRKNAALRSPTNASVTMNKAKFVPPLPDIEVLYRDDE